jgi:hypothetical protein
MQRVYVRKQAVEEVLSDSEFLRIVKSDTRSQVVDGII